MGKFDPFQGHAAKKSGVEITAAQAQAGVRLKQEGTPCFAHIMFSRSRKATSETEAKKETKAEAKAKTQKQFDNEAQCFLFRREAGNTAGHPRQLLCLAVLNLLFGPQLPVFSSHFSRFDPGAIRACPFAHVRMPEWTHALPRHAAFRARFFAH